MLSLTVIGQVSDDFSDGNFSSSPVWLGDTNSFRIVSGMLNSDGPSASDELYLSTSSTIVDAVIWEFLLDTRRSPSGSNRSRVYLISNRQDLEDDPEGYYVEIGQSGNDFIRFFKTSSSSAIFTGETVFTGNVLVRIRVVRDKNGNWSIFSDDSGGVTFSSEGPSFQDNTYQTAAFFGLFVDHTRTAKNDFYFDDIEVYKKPVDTAVVLNNDSLSVYFNFDVAQTDAENISNYTISKGIMIADVDFNPIVPREVTLVLDNSTKFTKGTYTVTVGPNLTTHSEDSVHFQFSQLTLVDIQALSDTIISLGFSEEVDLFTAENERNYILSGGAFANITPIRAEIDDLDKKRVSLAFESRFAGNTDYTLNVSNVENEVMSSRIATNTSTRFQYIAPVLLDSIKVISANTLRLFFNTELEQSIAEKASNYFIYEGASEFNPIIAKLGPDRKEVVLTMMSDFVDSSYKLAVTNVEDMIGTVIEMPGRISFTYLPLKLVHASFASPNAINLRFNQAIENSLAARKNGFTLDYEIGNPVSSGLSNGNDSMVVLTFDELFNNTYRLSIDSLINILQNASLLDTVVSIEVPKRTDFRAIQINEILPDPGLSLSEGEYVELHNTSKGAISIKDFTIQGIGGSVPDYTIPPDDYVILSHATNGYASFGKVLKYGSSVSLNNNGENLVLLDNFGNVVDSMTYNFSRDGVSIEQINPQIICNTQFNYTTSTTAIGGTPGAQNSVYDISNDNLPPVLLSYKILSDDSLMLVFNEPLDANNLPISSFLIDNLDTGGKISLSADLNEVSWILNTRLERDTTHQIIINNIHDCSGNAMDTAMIFFYDKTPPVIEKALFYNSHSIDVHFSEKIRANEGLVEDNYVIDRIITPQRANFINEDSLAIRLYFDSPFVFDNAGYKLSISTVSDTASNQNAAPLEYDLVAGQSIGSIKIKQNNFLEIHFGQDLNAATAVDTLNYLLDDAFHPIAVIYDTAFRNQVSLVFKDAIRENADHKMEITNLENSSHTVIPTPVFEFFYDLRPPKMVHANLRDSMTLEVIFDETIEIFSAENISNYGYRVYSDASFKIEKSIKASSIKRINNTTVLLTFSQPFVQEKLLQIAALGVEDSFGNVITTANSIASRSATFLRDEIPPRLLSVAVLDSHNLEMMFSETLSENSLVGINFLINDSINPVTLKIQDDGKRILVVTLPKDAIPMYNNKILIRNLKDSVGNTSEDIEVDFNNLNPSLYSLYPLSDSTILLRFTETLAASALDPNNYHLDETQKPTKVELRDSIIVLSFPGQTFLDSETYKLTVDNLTDLSGHSLLQKAYRFEYIERISSFNIIDKNRLRLVLTNELLELSVSSFSVNNGIGNPVAITQDGMKRKDETSSLTLFFEKDFQVDTEYEFTWLPQRMIERYLMPSQTLKFVMDNDSPAIVAFSQENEHSIVITFDEPIEERSLKAPNHYHLRNTGNPVSVKVADDNNKVMLTFDVAFQALETYELSIIRLKDLSGNISQDTIRFIGRRVRHPKTGELMITEIFADPSPPIRLPKGEFIELLNISTDTINLSGVSISNGTRSISLGYYEFPPGDYLILCDDRFEDEYAPFGNVLSAPSFLSLNNEGEKLSIDYLEENIFNIGYDNGWYKNNDKKNGGYSLEMINPGSFCADESNWMASKSLAGGTPGIQNSVFDQSLDTTSPVVLNGRLATDNEIKLEFSESLDMTTVEKSNFKGSSSNLPVDVTILAGEITLKLQNPVLPGTQYWLEISNLTDCHENRIRDTIVTFSVPKAADFLDLIITEIMIDPDPAAVLPSAEYIEIFNRSDHEISLDNILLSINKKEASMSGIALPGEFTLLAPTSSAQLFRDLKVENVIEVSGWDALTNTQGSISLFRDEMLISSVFYDQTWYKDNEKKKGGWSLEMIDLHNPCNGPINWSASEDVKQGSPGRENSIKRDNMDLFGPKLLTAFAETQRRVAVTINEAIDPGSLSVNSFSFAPKISILNYSLDHTLSKVNLELVSDIESGTKYTLTSNSIRDCTGNLISSNDNELSFYLPEEAKPSDIVINEVLFNPRVGGVDFIELYNQSQRPINLKKWSLVGSNSFEPISNQNLLLLPGTYSVLSKDSDIIKSHYPNAKNLWQLDKMPSFANGNGYVGVADSTGQFIDEFTYDEDYHFDIMSDKEGVSLERISFKQATQNRDNWKSSASVNGFATPGFANSQQGKSQQIAEKLSLSEKIFTPDNDGQNDFTLIHYKMKLPGSFANVYIYNSKGQIVTTLRKNVSLDTEGFFQWDGIDDMGSLVTIGTYIIVFEIYGEGGRKNVLKETVIVGRQF